ncbi:MAG: hypothetical protein WBQ57_05280, partial [Rhodanobacteraceae bacterium]
MNLPSRYRYSTSAPGIGKFEQSAAGYEIADTAYIAIHRAIARQECDVFADQRVRARDRISRTEIARPGERLHERLHFRNKRGVLRTA